MTSRNAAALCLLTVLAVSLSLVVWTRPAAAIAQPATTESMPTPALTIVGRMGIEMTESRARHGIAFAPFAPPRNIIAVALLPPFHGEDTRANRGIGFEYVDSDGRKYALAEWPANGGTIDRFEPYAGNVESCASARSFQRVERPSGIIWSTPRGLVMTFQSDGKNDTRTLASEWRHLVRRGACR